MPEGKFIVFEGGEGVGKSTQIRKLEAHLHSVFLPVIMTREPGGTPNAETLREVITASGMGAWSPLSEALIMTAARADHVGNVIKPALKHGSWVVCDRFTMSTNAYQGTGPDRVDILDLEKLHALAVGVTVPDLTFLLDMPPAVGLQRAYARGLQSRFERKPIEFHEAVRASYLRQAGYDPNCIVIDATRDEAVIAKDIRDFIQARFGIPAEPAAADE